VIGLGEGPRDRPGEAGGRRRVDRVLASDYLDGIEAMSLAELRALRREAQQEEADLSYVRRLLQGRIDILRAELARRGDEDEGAGSVMAQLPEILADEPAASPGSARYLTVGPSRLGEYRRRIEVALADVELSDLSARTDAELRGALDRLTGHEQGVSRTRHDVQRVADRCSAEIARRYRDGEASVSDLLHGQ
jgi:hypothetical protein